MSVSTDVILATAGWTEESTFRKFYNKPVAVTNQMSLAVLTQVNALYNKIVLQSSVQLKSACEVVCVLSHFVLTALKSHGNPDVHNDLVELKIKQDLPVS